VYGERTYKGLKESADCRGGSVETFRMPRGDEAFRLFLQEKNKTQWVPYRLYVAFFLVVVWTVLVCYRRRFSVRCLTSPAAAPNFSSRCKRLPNRRPKPKPIVKLKSPRHRDPTSSTCAILSSWVTPDATAWPPPRRRASFQRATCGPPLSLSWPDSDGEFRVAMRQIMGVFSQLEKTRLVKKLKAAGDRISLLVGSGATLLRFV
jgi:hypothetical protein